VEPAPTRHDSRASPRARHRKLRTNNSSGQTVMRACRTGESSRLVVAGRASPGEWPEFGRAAWRTDDFLVGENDTVAPWVRCYNGQVTMSRQISADIGLDPPCARQDLAPRNLRWVLLHPIEETTRHAGHVDIIRETLDGTRGI
jgi:Protein of unknown function (DUF664)